MQIKDKILINICETLSMRIFQSRIIQRMRYCIFVIAIQLSSDPELKSEYFNREKFQVTIIERAYKIRFL